MTTDSLLEPKTDASAERTPNPPPRKACRDNRDDDGVGRDPRRVSREELVAAGHKPMSPLNAIRARCVDCCAGELFRVRRCAHLDCPSWPYRMGTNPWQTPPTEDELFAIRRAAWRKQGIVVIRPAEVRDDWTRQALVNEAAQLHGRREVP